jgi:selenium metabolism protein YedF
MPPRIILAPGYVIIHAATKQKRMGKFDMYLKTFLITSGVLGKGEDQLGKILMANFLRLLGDNNDKPHSLIFWNSGVRLVCEGSPVLDHLKRLEAQGVEILACTTCLEYLELKEKMLVGKPTTMAKSIEMMLNSEIVCL